MPSRTAQSSSGNYAGRILGNSGRQPSQAWGQNRQRRGLVQKLGVLFDLYSSATKRRQDATYGDGFNLAIEAYVNCDVWLMHRDKPNAPSA
ncbi:hypothetical protein WJX82_006744 [Trebouxia sp. C0006]